MKRFEELTISQVKKEILFWEQDSESPRDINVCCVGQDTDGLYKQFDGSTCEHFFAVVGIEGMKYWRGYEWDCDEESITASWDGPVCDKVGYEDIP